jgi:hypothetical protein
MSEPNVQATFFCPFEADSCTIKILPPTKNSEKLIREQIAAKEHLLLQDIP